MPNIPTFDAGPYRDPATGNVTAKGLEIGYDWDPEIDAKNIERAYPGVTITLKEDSLRFAGVRECEMTGPEELVRQVLENTWGYDDREYQDSLLEP